MVLNKSATLYYLDTEAPVRRPLREALAFITGVTKRMGKVPDGNTISDYDKEEIKRQFSISTTLIPLEYEGENGPVKINSWITPDF